MYFSTRSFKWGGISAPFFTKASTCHKFPFTTAHDKVINSPNFIFDKSDKKMTDYIITLLNIRPGRTLFKRLLKADKPFKIILDPAKRSGFKPEESTVFLNDSEVSLSICTNPHGEKILHSNMSITLAHELVHVLHFFEEGPLEFMIKFMSRNIIDPELDDLEEQETIIGKEKEAVL